MARYQILAQMLTMPKPMPIAEADTPADALHKARDLEQKGRRDLQIGDAVAQQYYPIPQFAAKHGLR